MHQVNNMYCIVHWRKREGMRKSDRVGETGREIVRERKGERKRKR